MRFIVQGFPAYAYTGGRPHAPGSGKPAILFLHGAAFDHSVWQWQARFFAHHGHAVLAPDLPAHGRSPGALRTSIPALADWAIALLDAAGIERASLVGHSMGSLVALDAALRHAARVTHLALLGTALPMAVGDAFLAAARDDAPEAFDMEVAWGHSRGALLAASAVPGACLPAAARALNGRAGRGVLHADLEAVRAYAPAMEAVAALPMPVLVLAGARDQMTPPRHGRALANHIPGARLAELPCGHSMTTEAARETLAALRAFLPPGMPG